MLSPLRPGKSGPGGEITAEQKVGNSYLCLGVSSYSGG